VDLAEVYQQAAAKGLLERRVVIEEPLSKGPGIGARMIVLPKSAAQSDRSRLRVVDKNRKKGRRTHPMSLVAADYLVLLITLDAENYPAGRVIALYRMRWQIELAFKRLKSLIGIHKLPARDVDPDAPSSYLVRDDEERLTERRHVPANPAHGTADHDQASCRNRLPTIL